MSRIETIRRQLDETFRPVHLELEDESHQHASGPGAETHFRLVLVSAEFEGLSRIDRQRRVMDLLRSEMNSGLHALTQRVFTPAEWEAVQHQFEMTSPACYGGSKHDKKDGR